MIGLTWYTVCHDWLNLSPSVSSANQDALPGTPDNLSDLTYYHVFIVLKQR